MDSALDLETKNGMIEALRLTEPSPSRLLRFVFWLERALAEHGAAVHHFIANTLKSMQVVLVPGRIDKQKIGENAVKHLLVIFRQAKQRIQAPSRLQMRAVKATATKAAPAKTVTKAVLPIVDLSEATTKGTPGKPQHGQSAPKSTELIADEEEVPVFCAPLDGRPEPATPKAVGVGVETEDVDQKMESKPEHAATEEPEYTAMLVENQVFTEDVPRPSVRLAKGVHIPPPKLTPAKSRGIFRPLTWPKAGPSKPKPLPFPLGIRAGRPAQPAPFILAAGKPRPLPFPIIPKLLPVTVPPEKAKPSVSAYPSGRVASPSIRMDEPSEFEVKDQPTSDGHQPSKEDEVKEDELKEDDAKDESAPEMCTAEPFMEAEEFPIKAQLDPPTAEESLRAVTPKVAAARPKHAHLKVPLPEAAAAAVKEPTQVERHLEAHDDGSQEEMAQQEAWWWWQQQQDLAEAVAPVPDPEPDASAEAETEGEWQSWAEPVGPQDSEAGHEKGQWSEWSQETREEDEIEFTDPHLDLPTPHSSELDELEAQISVEAERVQKLEQNLMIPSPADGADSDTEEESPNEAQGSQDHLQTEATEGAGALEVIQRLGISAENLLVAPATPPMPKATAAPRTPPLAPEGLKSSLFDQFMTAPVTPPRARDPKSPKSKRAIGASPQVIPTSDSDWSENVAEKDVTMFASSLEELVQQSPTIPVKVQQDDDGLRQALVKALLSLSSQLG
ncbi:tRNA-uridine aminocarboxypropyltransferase [Durusdinium trenchii]|uniref:tRNA-uridine aminocarboxypropyltransferase n=1 Tax=Durusdinium trenchii TaxID=1381693 RepID=A0ABP0PFY2_9DINO